MRKFCRKVVGVDFACRSADIIAPAHDLPFEDKDFELITAFDMLEHLLPDEVEAVLKEFERVAKRFVFSISHVPSVIGDLHPTVRPIKWWKQMLPEGTTIAKGYFIGSFGN